MEGLAASIRPDTVLVSVMAVNNEIGVYQDLDAIGKLCRSKGVFFHTDAAQAAGKLVCLPPPQNLSISPYLHLYLHSLSALNRNVNSNSFIGSR